LKKILIIQTAFLGDVILTIPLVQTLEKKLEGVIIDFMVRPEAANCIETNPAIGESVIFDKRDSHRGIGGLQSLARQIARNKYDICLTPHRSWRSAYLSYRTKAPVRIGFNRSAWKGAFTNIIDYRREDHEILRNLALLEPLGIKPVLQRPKLFPTDKDKKHVYDSLKINSRKLVALAPGSIWPTKRWPEDYYRALVNLLTEHNFSVVLIGGKEDSVICDSIAAGGGERIQSLAGRFSLRQTCFLLTLCSCLVTNDSAPLHLGTAANIPIVAVFGATIPAFGFSPIGERDRIVEIEGLSCRPCGIHGHNKCPVKTFSCMERLSPNTVWRAVQEVVCN
jgi:heptosyltransferase-2